MRDRHPFGQRRGGLRAAGALVVACVITGCVTTAPIATEAPDTFALPSLPATSQRPVGLDDDVRIIDGFVTDEAGSALPNATVRLTTTDGSEIDAIESAADGEFGFATLAPPTMTVSASAPGHATVERTIVVDESQPQTFVENLRLSRLGDSVALGSEGGVVESATGAAVAFSKSSLPIGVHARVTDLTAAPPTDQLPIWSDGLERFPLGWVRVSLEGGEQSTPAVVVVPLSEAYDSGSVLEVRSYDDASGTWDDEGGHAVVGQSGKSAIASADHFSDKVIFSKRTRRVGDPTVGPDRELTAELPLAEGQQDCRTTDPVSVTFSTPPVTAEHGLELSVARGKGIQSWLLPYSQKVPSHTLLAQVQNVSNWAIRGRLVVPTRNQVLQTEVKARTTQDADSLARNAIEWPPDARVFVDKVIAEFGPVAIPDGITLTLPAVMRVKDFQSETRTFEYTVSYDSGSPRWDTTITTTPCPSTSPTASATPSPTDALATPTGPLETPIAGDPNVFKVTTSGLISTSISRSGPGAEDLCRVSLFRGSNYWTVAGSGFGSDGASYEWDAIVKAYSQPGTYTSDVNGHFSPSIGDPRGYSWGGVLPGATNTVTIAADERSGTFDLTLQPIINSQTPNGENLHVTGSFSCQLRTG